MSRRGHAIDVCAKTSPSRAMPRAPAVRKGKAVPREFGAAPAPRASRPRPAPLLLQTCNT